MQFEKNITSKQVREILGGKSDVSLWRFLNDRHLNFPKPIYINRRRLWSYQELGEWLDKQPRVYRPNQ